MRLTDFDFHLPERLIAHSPAQHRTDSRLMVVNRATKTITHGTFADIGTFLPSQSLLVLNRSRVLHARLLLGDSTPNEEIFLLRSSKDDPTLWECLVRPGKRFKLETTYTKLLHSPSGDIRPLTFTVDSILENTRLLRFTEDLAPLLPTFGHLPLPPYIPQEQAVKFADRYQTVYARESGSVAAPTAGLHFTEELLADLAHQGITHTSVLLHVGMGTFQPVKADVITEHTMHSEWFCLDQETTEHLNAHKAKGLPIVSVGTTSTRVLESCARNGVLTSCTGETDIFIYPSYQFQFIDHLITNFHLPKSTLLMLISAFAGTELIQEAYAEAIRQEYRFYSFGDSMLIL